MGAQQTTKGNAGVMEKMFCLLTEFMVAQICTYFKMRRAVLQKRQFYCLLFSPSVVSSSAAPWTAARQASLASTLSQSRPKLNFTLR